MTDLKWIFKSTIHKKNPSMGLHVFYIYLGYQLSIPSYSQHALYDLAKWFNCHVNKACNSL